MGIGEPLPIPFSPALVFENEKYSAVVVDLAQTGMQYVISLFPFRVNFGLTKRGKGFVPNCINLS